MEIVPSNRVAAESTAQSLVDEIPVYSEALEDGLQVVIVDCCESVLLHARQYNSDCPTSQGVPDTVNVAPAFPPWRLILVPAGIVREGTALPAGRRPASRGGPRVPLIPHARSSARGRRPASGGAGRDR